MTMAKTDSPESQLAATRPAMKGGDHAEGPAKGLHLDDDAQLHGRRGPVREQQQEERRRPRGTCALSPEKQSFDSGRGVAKTSLENGGTSLSQKASTVEAVPGCVPCPRQAAAAAG